MTVKQDKAIVALMTCTSKTEAAKMAGISPGTLSKYLADPEFLEAYKNASAGLLAGATKRLQQSFTAAIDRLVEVVKDRTINPAIAVNAARYLLEYGLRFTEFDQIMGMLEESEDDDCITTD